jgi:hypothetical protein
VHVTPYAAAAGPIPREVDAAQLIGETRETVQHRRRDMTDHGWGRCLPEGGFDQRSMLSRRVRGLVGNTGIRTSSHSAQFSLPGELVQFVEGESAEDGIASEMQLGHECSQTGHHLVRPAESAPPVHNRPPAPYVRLRATYCGRGVGQVAREGGGVRIRATYCMREAEQVQRGGTTYTGMSMERLARGPQLDAPGI